MHRAYPSLWKVVVAATAVLFLTASCFGGSPFSEDPITDLIAPRVGEVDLLFISGEQPWIANDKGYVFFSPDNGASWLNYPVPTEGELKAIAFSDNGGKGILVNSQGIVFHTSDQGASWNSNSIKDAIGQKDSDQVQTIDSSEFNIKLGSSLDTLYLGWNCAVYVSHDKGSSWENITTDLNRTIDDSCVDNFYLDEDRKVSHLQVLVSKQPYGLVEVKNEGEEFKIVCPPDEASISGEFYPLCPDDISTPLEYAVLGSEETYERLQVIHNQIMGQPTHIDKSELNDGIYTSSFKPSDADITDLSGLNVFTTTDKRVWFHLFGDLAYSDDMQNWHTITSTSYYKGAQQRNINDDIIQIENTRYTTNSNGTLRFTHYSENDGVSWRFLRDVNANPIFSVKYIESTGTLFGVTDNRLLERKEGKGSWTETKRFDSEISGFDIFENRIWIKHGEAEKSTLTFSEDGGLNWTTAGEIDLEGVYMERFECNRRTCLIIQYEDIVRIEFDEASNSNIIKNKIGYTGTGKYYARKYIISSDLKNMWFSNDLVFTHSSDYGATWSDFLEDKIHFDHTFVSPSGKNAIFFVRDGRSLIPYQLVNGEWLKKDPIKFPEYHMELYTHYTSAMCWLDDARALFYTEGKNLQPLYAATNDGGTTWQREDIHSEPGECWRENDRLLLRSYEVGIKP